MAARRFLWVVAALIVLVLAAAFLYRIFAPQLMRAAMTPKISFADSETSPPTFYDGAGAWLARPGIPSKETRWTPDGFAPAPKPAAAVFYVHPTTYLKRDRWNAPVKLTGNEDFRRLVFLKSQASAFNGVGEIWAPKYRQAAFGAFLSLSKPDAGKAFSVAYDDVVQAFRTFLASIPEDKPIILAGHSQGSLHLVTLLAREIAGTPVSDRIIAAYLVGWPITIEHDLGMLGLPPCRTPDQTRCIMNWQSYSEPAETDHIFKAFFTTTGLDGLPRAGGTVLCTNPLTGGIEESAPPEANLGTMIARDEEYENADLEPGLVGAECSETGYLSIGENPPEIGSFVLPGNNYHVYDYALFWTNIRADAERRTQAFLNPAAAK